jgi:hypothetical protein
LPATATVNDNIPMQYDFRSIYATLLEKWFCLDKSVVDSLFPPNVNSQLQSLPLIKAGVCNGVMPPNPSPVEVMVTNYPNPFQTTTTIKFRTAGGHTLIQIMDTLGRVLTNLVDKEYAAGTYTVTFDSEPLPPGVYYARFQNGVNQHVRAMLKVR